MTELRWFKTVVIAITLIPLTAGLVGAFGGLEGLCALFGEDRHVQLAPAIRNNLRAICWMFFVVAPTLWWTLGNLAERASVFRIVVGLAVLGGIARIVGALVDGWPGPAPIFFTVTELGVLPIVLLWHARLVRRAA